MNPAQRQVAAGKIRSDIMQLGVKPNVLVKTRLGHLAELRKSAVNSGFIQSQITLLQGRQDMFELRRIDPFSGQIFLNDRNGKRRRNPIQLYMRVPVVRPR